MSAVVPVVKSPLRLRTSVAISILDQAWLSAANLFLGVFLIKHSSKEEYGGYVLGYAIILFIVGVQNALVTTQMSVLAPARSASEQARFCAALAIGQFVVFVPAALFIAMAGLMLSWGGEEKSSSLAYAIAISLLGVILREFFRSYFFLKLRPLAVLCLDVIFVVLLFTGLWAASQLQFMSINISALALMGIASAVVGLASIFMTRSDLPIRLVDIAPALRESWQHGKWALGGVTVTWLQDQSYIYLLSAMVSTAETAEVSAARLFLAPLALINAGFSRVLMPRWAYMAHEGKHGEIEETANRVKWILVGMVVSYVAVLLLLKDWLVPLLLTGAYTQAPTLIALWGVMFALQLVRGNYASLLQVYKRFRHMTLSNTATAIGVLGIGAVLIKAFGAKGSMVALIVGEIMLIILLVYGYKNVKKNNAG